MRTDFSDMSRRSSPSASASKSSASARASRVHSRLRSIIAFAGSRPCDAQRLAAALIELFGRQGLAKPQGDGAVADAAGKADAIGRVGGKEDGVAGRADDVPTGRIVLGKHAAERQHDGILALPLDVAAGVRHGTGLEQADLQRLAFKQCFTADFHGAIPAS